MTVNTLEFPFFFLIVFAVYYLPFVSRTVKTQNLWLLTASYVFYGMTDWKMLLLLIGSTIVFHFLGKTVYNLTKAKKEKKASMMTTVGVVIGIAILVAFKYLDFFAQSIADMLRMTGLNISWTTLNIIVPVGVSFFTFKLIAYIIEIHRGRIQPATIEQFAAYIAFFPTILSGPIDKPDKFIPQISKSRRFDYALAVDGCRQVLWGVMIKMCVADNLSAVTDAAWSGIATLPASYLFVAALLYPLQLYTDFNGYSHMAIGVAKILGIRVERNFNHPLLARNIAEYWRRWHISLTSWITNYIFTPLNIHLRSIGKWGVCIAAFVNLVVIGLWHGPNWTYVIFGIYHGLLFIPMVFVGAFGKNKKIKPLEYHIHGYRIALPAWKDLFMMAFTYLLVTVGLVVFRAPDINEAITFFSSMANSTILTMPRLDIGIAALVLTLMIVMLDWICRKDEHPLQTACRALHNHRWMRWALYYIIAIIIIRYQGNATQFIYFQF